MRTRLLCEHFGPTNVWAPDDGAVMIRVASDGSILLGADMRDNEAWTFPPGTRLVASGRVMVYPPRDGRGDVDTPTSDAWCASPVEPGALTEEALVDAIYKFPGYPGRHPQAIVVPTIDVQRVALSILGRVGSRSMFTGIAVRLDHFATEWSLA